MKVTALDQIASFPMAMDGVLGVTKQVPVGKDDDVPNFSFRVFTIEPGGHTPYHQHVSEHVNYVIEGEGALVDEAGDLHPIKAGDFAFVKPNEKHQYRNTSDHQAMKMICAVPVEYE